MTHFGSKEVGWGPALVTLFGSKEVGLGRVGFSWVFMVPRGFLWFCMVPSWFFMDPGGFSGFFMDPGWFFMFSGWYLLSLLFQFFFCGFHGARLVFHCSRSVFMVFRVFMGLGWFFIFHVENTLKLYSGPTIQSS